MATCDPPVQTSDYINVQQNQFKTLRDEFAMAAISGLVEDTRLEYICEEELARKSYEIADAMMKAREGMR